MGYPTDPVGRSKFREEDSALNTKFGSEAIEIIPEESMENLQEQHADRDVHEAAEEVILVAQLKREREKFRAERERLRKLQELDAVEEGLDRQISAARQRSKDIDSKSGKAKESNPPPPVQKPIRFKDAVGRKFSFPFHLCKTWAVSTNKHHLLIQPLTLDRAWKHSFSKHFNTSTMLVPMYAPVNTT